MNKRYDISTAAALLSAAAIACSASAQPYEYAVFDMGYLEYQFASSSGINDFGAAVGVAGLFLNYHAFTWEEPGPMEDLGTLGGHDWYSEGAAINNLGWIAGSSGESSTRDVPVLWRDGMITELSGTIPGERGFALDLNDNGQVVGRWKKDPGLGDYAWLAFVWQDGVMMQLPSLIGGDAWSAANAINDAGDIVGWTEDVRYNPSVLWRAGEVINLGALPGRDAHGEARDINDCSQIVGHTDGD